MKKTPTVEENDGKHLNKIVDAIPCRRHGRDIGQACWNIPSIHGIMKAICDHRAREAGANGNITPDPKYGNAPIKKDYR